MANSSEDLWDKFERAFKSAWKDRERKQTAYIQLMKLMMKDLDINLYMVMFDHLATATGWEPNAKGTIQRFTQGLRDNVHRRVLS